jgi:hypothetical protein
MRRTTLALVSLLVLGATADAFPLTIIRHFVNSGAPAPNMVGGGNLVDIFNAAADRWELAIRDEHVVVLHFGWSGIGCLGAEHYLQNQGGSPNRETEGTIYFDNLGFQTGCPTCPCGQWYMDPTPWLNEEFANFVEEFADAGGGLVNVTRMFSGATGDAALPNEDFYSVALHEIGHALGLSVGNAAFQAESGDHDIDVTAPRPLPGTTIPLASNNAGVTSHIESSIYNGPLMASVNPGTRKFLTGLDILANAQLSRFQDLDLDPQDPVPLSAGTVPDQGGSTPLIVLLELTGDLTLMWPASCGSSDDDYEIYEGTLGDFTSLRPRFCSTGGATAMTFSPASPSSYYLVVARNGLREGSYGTDSAGRERPQAEFACRPRVMAACN